MMLAIAVLLLVRGALAWNTYSVRSYGAVGDGISYDTKPVRAAAAAVTADGGGELLFPASRGGLSSSTYLTG